MTVKKTHTRVLNVCTMSFHKGDIVFAKVRGHPYWPAQIDGVEQSSYSVVFYGTQEM